MDCQQNYALDGEACEAQGRANELAAPLTRLAAGAPPSDAQMEFLTAPDVTAKGGS
jgi:hypothetical protein